MIDQDLKDKVLKYFKNSKMIQISHVKKYLSDTEIKIIQDEYDNYKINYCIKAIVNDFDKSIFYCKYCNSKIQTTVLNRAFNEGHRKQCQKCRYKEAMITSFEKTGYYHPQSNPDVRDKISKNSKNNDPRVKQRIRETTLRNHGAVGFASEVLKNKSRNTYFLKTGYFHNMHNPNFIRSPIGVKKQKIELNVLNFIQNNYSGDVVNGSFSIITPYQLDIYLPDLKLAIEVNGNYWHSIGRLSFNKQLEKTELCECKGIRLIHIWEHEWRQNQEFIKELLKLYLENKVHQDEFYKLLEQFNRRLPRDYFSVLDFPGEIEEPVLEKSGNFDVYKTGHIIL